MRRSVNQALFFVLQADGHVHDLLHKEQLSCVDERAALIKVQSLLSEAIENLKEALMDVVKLEVITQQNLDALLGNVPQQDTAESISLETCNKQDTDATLSLEEGGQRMLMKSYHRKADASL